VRQKVADRSGPEFTRMTPRLAVLAEAKELTDPVAVALGRTGRQVPSRRHTPALFQDPHNYLTLRSIRRIVK
jgi:hypothetical protein